MTRANKSVVSAHFLLRNSFGRTLLVCVPHYNLRNQTRVHFIDNYGHLFEEDNFRSLVYQIDILNNIVA